MGLCASQGRLLMLTSRKSDLELQAQFITQSRAVLSSQQTNVATEYSESTTNQKLEVRKEGSTESKPLTPESLVEAGYGIKYKGVDLTSVEDIKKAFGEKHVNGESGEDNLIQRALLLGAATLLEPETDDAGVVTSWTETSIAGTNNVYSNFFTGDDAAAKAKYDKEIAQLQAKDKKLELELNQIETQHNAIQTEIESVQKIIDKNVEKSFKIFSES